MSNPCCPQEYKVCPIPSFATNLDTIQVAVTGGDIDIGNETELITSPGKYRLKEDFTHPITIMGKNIYLFFNGHVIDLGGKHKFGIYVIDSTDVYLSGEGVGAIRNTQQPDEKYVPGASALPIAGVIVEKSNMVEISSITISETLVGTYARGVSNFVVDQMRYENIGYNFGTNNLPDYSGGFILVDNRNEPGATMNTKNVIEIARTMATSTNVQFGIIVNRSNNVSIYQSQFTINHYRDMIVKQNCPKDDFSKSSDYCDCGDDVIKAIKAGQFVGIGVYKCSLVDLFTNNIQGGEVAVSIINSSNVTIRTTTAHDMSLFGIRINDSKNVSIEDNFIGGFKNSTVVTDIVGKCFGNSIVKVEKSHSVSVNDNNFIGLDPLYENETYIAGVLVDAASYFVVILDNTIQSAFNGIILYGLNNIVQSNLVSFGKGVGIWNNVDKSEILKNKFTNNSVGGYVKEYINVPRIGDYECGKPVTYFDNLDFDSK